jgi:hypothetical protein
MFMDLGSMPVVESGLLHHGTASGILEDGLLERDPEEGITMHVFSDIQAVHKPAPVLCPPACR